ncbi:NAD(P)-dependent glycerol-3-phosphate dehydrogenase [Roseovarius sp. SCSIO 43702]|uniref:NAD(P)H-dependent glycerol-3-phosphate dehydrogenase n=1 Tax=Roseovarius sp. SCSIO 43702 TaxID=2823043 RepID=UPI001C730DF3|nr:NAD(P)H-dependent glycerol-3-phosphate dehydrogenase [Roseovarius sp. SCSIO 43702]QYX57390.1 NAD(P)-dependent glycerol-3-phosphate dehydrogenase [Roseovarius sp. SCSIO 43702]
MIGVMGAGAFGTALAVSFARSGDVVLYARDAEQVREMRETRTNETRLPGVTLPEALEVTDDLARLGGCAAVLLSVPTQKLRGALEGARHVLAGKPLVACCKGVERDTQASPTRIIAETVPDATPAVLTGPSFAADIARGLPTALTLACADEVAAEGLQELLRAPHLRLYRTGDVTGAELGGALKNVIAIACGAAIGAGLGESARAALMTRGYAEMARMAEALGAEAETLAGLSGFGDLALTCMSEQSRNLRYGLSLGREEAFEAGVTVEGAATARAVQDRARGLGIEMPITDAVVALVAGELRVREAMDMLLARPLKEE